MHDSLSGLRGNCRERDNVWFVMCDSVGRKLSIPLLSSANACEIFGTSRFFPKSRMTCASKFVTASSNDVEESLANRWAEKLGLGLSESRTVARQRSTTYLWIRGSPRFRSWEVGSGGCLPAIGFLSRSNLVDR